MDRRKIKMNGKMEIKQLDVSRWTLEFIHDLLARRRREGWVLVNVTNTVDGSTILHLARQRSA